MSHRRKCCCCECTACGGFGPPAYLVTIAGVSTCVPCNTGGGNSRLYFGDINGTYRLPCNDAIQLCSWRYVDNSTSPIYAEQYSGGSCAGAATSVADQLIIQLVKSGGTFSFLAHVGGGSIATARWFEASVTAGCNDEVTDLANIRLCSSFNTGGTGGTVSWAPD